MVSIILLLVCIFRLRVSPRRPRVLLQRRLQLRS
jgi:hypothetical protein